MKTLFVYLILFAGEVVGQTFVVTGKVSTSTGSVRFATVTFVDKDDTSRRFSALTDTLGNYSIGIITSVKPQDNLPAKFELEQNYPNPFSTTTVVAYKLKEQTSSSVKVYNVLGQLVREFRLGTQPAGVYDITWDGTNSLGRRVAPGVYFYQLIAGNKSQVKKMLFGLGGKWTAQASPVGGDAIPKISMKPGTPSSIRNFHVSIQNTDTTSPLVDCAQLDKSVSQSDTTLNFAVHEFDYSLCYETQDTVLRDGEEVYPVLQIYLNNSSGTNPKNIANWPYDCYGPMWSPNGRYITFWRENQSLLRHVYVYNVLRDSCFGLLTLDTSESQPVAWTPDSKSIIFENSSHVVASPVGTYIININGTNCREIKYPVQYLYSDGYNTIYTLTSSQDTPEIYHSNLDGTLNEFIVDLGQYVATSTGGVSIEDFDPVNHRFLIGLDDPSTALPNCIGEYNLDQKSFDTVVVADSGWKVYRPKYSTDYSEISYVAVDWADDSTYGYTNKIIIRKNGTDSTAIQIRDKNEALDFNPFAFSTDDKYYAFVIDVFRSGQFASWDNYIYVTEIGTLQQTYIDEGIAPIWNPALAH